MLNKENLEDTISSNPSPVKIRQKRQFKRMKTFSIPPLFKSNLIGSIKEFRRSADKLKKDFNPSFLDFGPVKIYLSRHFGFCYGVENAIETAYKIIEENPGKRVFLLSEMIHNPLVNADLLDRGVKFIQDTKGNQLIPWSELSSEDIVIIPAFGTTLEIEDILNEIGINIHSYNTTCPFVEKVWNRANTIGSNGYSIIVHGKPNHEETKATFSHTKEVTPTLVIRNITEAKKLGPYLRKEKSKEEFYKEFAGQFSEGFDPLIHLEKIGVVNQTTMLATETQEIVDYLKGVLIDFHKDSQKILSDYFADTKDTLCYATNDNQTSTLAMLNYEADLAIVAGGYNSSNTAHIVELCNEKLPTFFISSAEKIISSDLINHFDYFEKQEILTNDFLPQKEEVKIMLTCGASCPDAVVEEILKKIISFYPEAKSIDSILLEWKNSVD
ncbi:MAG: 4-hydroxy-3-methylbut-2-enyl diphosphate reductase [Bacteroidota bacterium]|jgi:4-hydroxy-3-methylbut-2-enyl diphosphate reductase